MAHSVNMDRMFNLIKFYKRGNEIAEKASLLIAKISSKINEREDRIKAICEEHNLGPSDLYALTQSASNHAGTGRYNYSNKGYKAPARDVPAGVASAYITESDQIESERTQIRSLELLARNVDPDKVH